MYKQFELDLVIYKHLSFVDQGYFLKPINIYYRRFMCLKTQDRFFIRSFSYAKKRKIANRVFFCVGKKKNEKR